MVDSTRNGKVARRALGRGLSSLISTPAVAVPITEQAALAVVAPQAPAEVVMRAPEVSTETREGEVVFVSAETVVPNPEQPRQEFRQQELDELSASIKSLGVLQPILVRPSSRVRDTYEIVAGERRWRAAQHAGLVQLPVIIRNLTDAETLEIALVENVQRSDLNPIEEARAYQRLHEQFSLSQQQLAERVGKDRASIANYLRLLKLPDDVIELIGRGSLSMGHAKAILTVKEPSAQRSLAKRIVDQGLSVRQLEEIVQRVVTIQPPKGGKKGKKKRAGDRGSFPEVLDRMREALGTKVTLHHKRSGRGSIQIEYFSEEDLDRIVDLIAG